MVLKDRTHCLSSMASANPNSRVPIRMATTVPPVRKAIHSQSKNRLARTPRAARIEKLPINRRTFQGE